MKPKAILTALTAIWALVVLLEGASSLIRRLYAHRMGAVARVVSGLIGYGKMALMVALAISNAALFLRHVEDGDSR